MALYICTIRSYQTYGQEPGSVGTVSADNRAALLAAARHCLEHPGLSRTTARVVAAQAQVSPAAIGYHFGTVRNLMTTAALEATRAWGAQLVDSLQGLQQGRSMPASREELWDVVIASFDGHRPGLLASYELLALAQDDETIRTTLQTQLDHAYLFLADTFYPGHERRSETERRRVGTALYTIISGLMTQWLVNPRSMPNGSILETVLGSPGDESRRNTAAT